MPALQLEYPLAGAVVGLSFPAGGEYDPSRLKEKPAPKTVLKVRCQLVDMGGATFDSSEFTIPDPGVATTWAVNFTLANVPQNPCTVKAFRVVNNVLQQPHDDAAQDVTVGAPAGQPEPGGMIAVGPG